jgi:hypothetical protein
MKRSILPGTVALLLTLLIAPASSGQQITDALRVTQPGLHYNAHALAMGNAYSTIGYDLSALLFNLATLGVDNRFSWTVTANVNAFKSSSDYYGNEVKFTTSNTAGGQTGLTVPFKLDSTRTIVFGLGYTQSKDFNLGYKYEGFNTGTGFPTFVDLLSLRDDPTARALGLTYPTYDGSGNYLGDQTVLTDSLHEKGYLLGQGGLSHYSFGFAVNATESIFFGASVSYNSGHYTGDLELSAVDSTNAYPSGVETVPGDPTTSDFVAADYRTTRDKEYRGWDGRFGMLYKLKNLVGISVSFKVPSSQKVTEDIFVSGRSVFGSGSLVAPEVRTTNTYHFKPPTEMTVGAMTNLWILTATAQATVVDYAAMKITSGAGSVPDEALINKRIKDSLSAVMNLNAGVEARLPWTGLCARAGMLYQPSPFMEDPSKFALKAVTLGAGINTQDLMRFDIGYAYAWRHENQNQATGDANSGDEKNGYHTLLFSMRVAF